MHLLRLLVIALIAISFPLQSFEADQHKFEAMAATIANEAAGRRLIVLGELHGTQEAPRLAASLAQLLSEDKPLVLGIEISRGEAKALANYVAAPSPLLSRLRSRPAWQKPREQNDGRRSEEMLALVDAVRVLRSQGKDVAIVPFDVERTGVGAEARDLAMAQLLRVTYNSLLTGRLLVLTGNVHAMKKKPVSCPQCQTPMTSHLIDLSPFSVNVVARSGSFWGCRSSCDSIPVGPTPRPEEGIYDFVAVFGAFTPANPIEP